MTATTTNLAISYPVSTDAINQGPADFEAIANAVDSVVPTLAADVLQAGVVGSGDGVIENPAVSGAGAISATGTSGGAAWATLSGGALVRNTIPTGSLSSTPGSLPASSKYAVVGIDLVTTTFSGTASLALSSKGADETSQALAIANPPSVASGHLRLMDVVILNTSGTYSLSTSVDRRTFAGVVFGGWVNLTAPTGLYVSYSAYLSGGGGYGPVSPHGTAQARVELGGIVRLRGAIYNLSATVTAGGTIASLQGPIPFPAGVTAQVVADPATTGASAWLNVTSAGALDLSRAGSASWTAGGVSLDGVTF